MEFIEDLEFILGFIENLDLILGFIENLEFILGFTELASRLWSTVNDRMNASNNLCTKGSHTNAYENVFAYNSKVRPEAIRISRSTSSSSFDAIMSRVWDPGEIIHFSVGKCSYTELFEVMDAVNFGVHWGS